MNPAKKTTVKPAARGVKKVLAKTQITVSHSRIMEAKTVANTPLWIMAAIVTVIAVSVIGTKIVNRFLRP